MRHPDWPERLAAVVSTHRHDPFVWGTHDCAMWAFRVTAAITDTDPGAAYRGQYDDALGAARILQQIGGLRALASTHWQGLESPMRAARGDIVAVELADGREALAVVLCTHAAGPGADGLVMVPMRAWRAGWRVD
jgi:hypothetical protein